MKQFTLRPLAIAVAIFAVGCSEQHDRYPAQSRAGVEPVPAVINRDDASSASNGQPREVPVTEDLLARDPAAQLPARKMLLRETLDSAREQVAGAEAGANMSPTVAGYVVSDLDAMRPAVEPVNRENYAQITDNPVKRVAEEPVSTFSIDVDTGAYANVRRMLKAGQLPAQDAVRAEELINYFTYDYTPPADTRQPFSLVREIAPAPWKPDTQLLHIGIQGYEVPASQLPPANLVFLIDVSGSMESPDKLDLLKSSLKLLTRQLDARDSVSMVVYAGASGVVLEPTPGNQGGKIIAALDRLQAGGSTNGGAGIQLAYAMAEQGFINGGINRVILATDGDFNVGTTNVEMLKDLIEEKRKSGISLTTLGFGTGNYNDQLMEQLADTGNGNYAYIDTLNEARKVLVDEIGSTMMTIAKDVKIQIEFNPAVVAEYRLIGYENRLLNREDFNNDKVDAGEIGAGHSVTALYEVALVDGSGQRMDPLRYQRDVKAPANGNEIAHLRLRYKAPGSDTSQLLEWPILRSEILPDLARASDNFRFSAAVAAFAQNLRGGRYTGGFGFDAVAQLAGGARGTDAFGYRGEFVGLVNLARALGQVPQQVNAGTPSG